jgi:hypothetical protein
MSETGGRPAAKAGRPLARGANAPGHRMVTRIGRELRAPSARRAPPAGSVRLTALGEGKRQVGNSVEEGGASDIGMDG